MQSMDFFGSFPRSETTRAISETIGCVCFRRSGHDARIQKKEITCLLDDALSESKNKWLCAPSAVAMAAILGKDARGTKSDLLKTIMWMQRCRSTEATSAAFLTAVM